jgi:hypothetical protein
VSLEDDPQGQHRSELPPLPKEPPTGYRPGWQLEERLLGLGVVVLGLIGLAVTYAISIGLIPVGLTPPNPPPGVLVPIFNPAACFIPIMALGSVALIVVGFRRVIDP